ncbi:histidine phosphatase family protein [Mycolicibacterium gilvum]|uniref:histidine phosphatase family protein n=1 Tax=Mycolicibacterium gilvum TaxID=1804 RepID=UPI004045475D
MPDPRTCRVRRILIAALSAVLLVLVSAIPSWAMTLTFVRHAESLANEAGIIDTRVPGPGLSEAGELQARAIAPVLAGMGFDGIYVSSMLRTQLTAQPMLDLLPGSSYQVLPGLREISAGIFEGASENEGLGRLGYALAPVTWLLGARFVPVPGGEDGNAFDARVDGAIAEIADNGDENAVAFAHGATIMFWVMMNVDNPDLLLMLRHQLDNVESVVVEGSPEEGWTLVSWAGQPVSADPSLATKLLVNVRDLVVAPQTALYNVGTAFASGDFETLVHAVRDGLIEVTRAVVRFIPDTVRDIVDEFRPPAVTPTEDSLGATDVHRAVVNAASQDDDEAEPQSVAVAEAETRNGSGVAPAGSTPPSGDEVTGSTDDDEATASDVVLEDTVDVDTIDVDTVEEDTVESDHAVGSHPDAEADDAAPANGSAKSSDDDGDSADDASERAAA